MRVRRLLLALAAVALTGLVLPAGNGGHGLALREDVLVPTWLFPWGVALVLIVSFRRGTCCGRSLLHKRLARPLDRSKWSWPSTGHPLRVQMGGSVRSTSGPPWCCEPVSKWVAEASGARNCCEHEIQSRL